jgi:hypothetical protein
MIDRVCLAHQPDNKDMLHAIALMDQAAVRIRRVISEGAPRRMGGPQ